LTFNTKLSVLFTLLFFIFAATWFAFPELNLEPLIVLVTAIIAFERLYDSYFKCRLAELLAKKQNYNFINTSKKVNAIEGGFNEFSAGAELELWPQKVKHTPNKIEVYFNQTSLDLRATFENNTTSKPYYKFDIGYNSDEEYALEKVTNQYFLIQYDIDNDGLDEYLFGVIDGKDVEINVLKYFPPLRENDLNRRANWSVIERVRADFIVKPIVVELNGNTLKIERGHRGFYYKWLFTENEVADVSYI